MTKPEPAAPKQPTQTPSLDTPRLGQRKFAASPAKAKVAAGAGTSSRNRLDELKTGIILLANKNFDNVMYILRVWQKEK